LHQKYEEEQAEQEDVTGYGVAKIYNGIARGEKGAFLSFHHPPMEAMLNA
jgi:hypothetical protein